MLDEVELDDWFAVRVPTLILPHFLRGRLRHCFAIALREQCRAKIEGDAAEVRAWKLFGWVPMMLLHRPRHAGSIGRDELAKRADDIAQGHWRGLQDSVRTLAAQTQGRRDDHEEAERVRRGIQAQIRVQQGQVSRARQALVGAALARTPKRGHSDGIAAVSAPRSVQRDPT